MPIGIVLLTIVLATLQLVDFCEISVRVYGYMRVLKAEKSGEKSEIGGEKSEAESNSNLRDHNEAGNKEPAKSQISPNKNVLVKEDPSDERVLDSTKMIWKLSENATIKKFATNDLNEFEEHS